jgi:hypothetical protein
VKQGTAIDGSEAGAATAQQFEAAYKSLRADPSVQFNLTPAPSEPKPPAWLEAFFKWLGELFEPVGRFLQWLGNFLPDAAYARIFLWTVLAIAALALGWALYNRLRHGRWTLRHAQATEPAELDDQEWIPEEQLSRSWLQEADALAREGRYAEAAHHLLIRSVEDIASRRPNLVRPALTSREIARAQGLPQRAGELFAGIAALVERSLFGGRPVAESDWLEARERYSTLALAGSWRS